MEQAIRRFFSFALTRAALVNAAILIGLLITFALVDTLNLDPQIGTFLSFALVGGSVIAISYFRFGLNPLKLAIAESPAEPNAFSARRCLILVGVSIFVIIYTSIMVNGEVLFALIGPVAILMEEVIFRGVPFLLITYFRTSRIITICIALLFSASFTALHLSPFVEMYIDRFMFSFLAIMLVVKFQSLWPGVLYHLLANIVAMSIAAPFYNENQVWLFIPIDLTIFILVFILSSRKLSDRIVSDWTKAKTWP